MPHAGWLPSQEQNFNIGASNGKEFPLAWLVDLILLTSDIEFLYESASSQANLLLYPEEGAPDHAKTIAALVDQTRKASPLQMAYNLLVLLESAATQDNEQANTTFNFGGQEWTIFECLNYFLSQVLRYPSVTVAEKTVGDTDLWRSPYFKAAHACILRVAIHATGSSRHLQKWNEEMETTEAVMGQWLNVALALTERLFPLLIGRYGTESELQTATEEAVYALDLPYDAPASFHDRLSYIQKLCTGRNEEGGVS